jgi:hypothetical protein
LQHCIITILYIVYITYIVGSLQEQIQSVRFWMLYLHVLKQTILNFF